MGVSLSFHHFTTGQQDVRQPLPIPMVYEDAPAAQWEYHVLTIDAREEALPDEAQLNELGRQGWLLVGMLEQRGSREHGLVNYYFVRQQL